MRVPEESGGPEPCRVAPGVMVLERPGAPGPAGTAGGRSGGPSRDRATGVGGRGEGRRGVGGWGEGRSGRSRLRRAVPRLLLAISVAVVVLGIVAVTGRSSPGSSDVPASLWSGPVPTGSVGPASASAMPVPSVVVPTASTPSGGAAGWRLVMTQLDAERSAAFASLDAGRLLGYAVAGSPALAHDEALIGQLADRGLRPVGLATSIESAELEDSGSGSTVLRVVDRRGAYAVVDAEGAVVEQVPASGVRTWRVTLERAGAAQEQTSPQWRVVDVTAVD